MKLLNKMLDGLLTSGHDIIAEKQKATDIFLKYNHDRDIDKLKTMYINMYIVTHFAVEDIQTEMNKRLPELENFKAEDTDSSIFDADLEYILNELWEYNQSLIILNGYEEKNETNDDSPTSPRHIGLPMHVEELINRYKAPQKYKMHRVKRIANYMGGPAHFYFLLQTGLLINDIHTNWASGNYGGVAINIASFAIGTILETAGLSMKAASSAYLLAGKESLKTTLLRRLHPVTLGVGIAYTVYDLQSKIRDFIHGDNEAMIDIVIDCISIVNDFASFIPAYGATIGPIVSILLVGASYTAHHLYNIFIEREETTKILHLNEDDKKVFVSDRLFGGHLFEEEARIKPLNNALANLMLKFLKQNEQFKKMFIPSAEKGNQLENGNTSIVQYHTGLSVEPFIYSSKPNLWDYSYPDNPQGGRTICSSYQRSYESRFDPGFQLEYACENTIGIENLESKERGGSIYFDMAMDVEVDGKFQGSENDTNVFNIGGGKTTIIGGNKNDVFNIQGFVPKSDTLIKITGLSGDNAIIIGDFDKNHQMSFDENKIHIKIDACTIYNFISMENINTFVGRPRASDIFQVNRNIKFIDGRGGKDQSNMDEINISAEHAHT